MQTSQASLTFGRRDLLRGAMLLVGATAVGTEALAATDRKFFAAPQRVGLDLLCETMIPRTDTPGAIDAGVPAFIDSLMVGWASPASQARMRGIVTQLIGAAQSDTGKPLARLSPAERTSWLARQDAALLTARDPGYDQFKRLVLIGYYYSEAGATQELRYELVPGIWEPSIPMTPETRAWA